MLKDEGCYGIEFIQVNGEYIIIVKNIQCILYNIFLIVRTDHLDSDTS